MDPLSANLTAMYVQLIKDSLNEYAYSAGLAGLSWDIASSKYGIIVSKLNFFFFFFYFKGVVRLIRAKKSIFSIIFFKDTINIYLFV